MRAHRAGAKPRIDLVDAEKITPDTAEDLLGVYDAIVVPGGFGDRGVDGMIVAARYAREQGVPFLAMGFGMQLAVVEAVRSLLGIDDAHTAEADPLTPHPVVRVPEDRVCQNDSRGATRMGSSGVRLLGWRIAAYLWGRCGARASFQPLRGGPRLT